MSITAHGTEPFETTAENFPTGLAGTIGVRITDPGTATTIVARSTTGITEYPAGSGLYAAVRSFPTGTPSGVYRADWDTGGGSPHFASEEIVYTAAFDTGSTPIDAPLTYASVADLRAYAPQVTGTDEELGRLLLAAEQDIDMLLTGVRDETTGHKADPSVLPAYQVTALRNATCAQAEYRFTRGPDFFVLPGEETKGPDFTITGSLQIIGSKARSALIGGNLLQTMARARP
jgi:hypothetical protein